MTKQEIEKLRKQGLTLKAVGDKFGTSKQRVWQTLYPEKNQKIHERSIMKYQLKLQNLALEICSLAESGTLTVGGLGISQESVDSARKLIK